MSEKRMKLMITLGITIFVIIITILILLINFDTTVDKKTESKDGEEKQCIDVFKGIIVDIDKTIFSVRDFDNIKEIEVVYTTECKIKNRYGKEIYHDRLQIGDIVEIGYKQSLSNLKYIHLDSDILHYKNLKNFRLDNDAYYVELDDKKYRLKDETFVYGNKEERTIHDLNEDDVLTLNIMGKDIVSVVVEKGHSFVELANYDGVLGYSLIVNDDESYEIVENLKIAVPEGKNQFVIKNDKYTGNIALVNLANNTNIIDIKKVKFEKRKEGTVKFYIEPDNARLYISGKSYNYDEPIVLDYGKYKYSVESIGYDTISDYLLINSDEKKMSVYLQEKLNTAQPSATPSATNNVTNAEETQDEISDEEITEDEPTLQPTSTTKTTQ